MNLSNALHTSLLLMPEQFTLEELFVCIAQLSYSGDLRMVVGENRNKVVNIVRPQLDRFARLYTPQLVRESAVDRRLECDFRTGRAAQSLDQATLYHHMNQLPKKLLHTIINTHFRRVPHTYDLEEYVHKMAYRIDYREIIATALRSIVTWSSTVQTLKGVLTAGPLKTVNYSVRKLKKMFKK